MAQLALPTPKPKRGATPPPKPKRPTLTKKAQHALLETWAAAFTAQWGCEITALHRPVRGAHLYWLTVVWRDKGRCTLTLLPRPDAPTAYEVVLWYGATCATWDVPDQTTGAALSPEILAVLELLFSARGAAASS